MGIFWDKGTRGSSDMINESGISVLVGVQGVQARCNGRHVVYWFVEVGI